MSTFDKDDVVPAPRKVIIHTRVSCKINLGDYSNFEFEHSQQRLCSNNEAAIARMERKLNEAIMGVMETRLAEWREAAEGARQEAIGT